MSQVDLDPTLPDLRTGWAVDGGMAVLIAVPEVEAGKIRPARRQTGMSAPSTRGRLGLGPTPARRPRRRLRREVRVAGRILLVLAPLVGAIVLIGSSWASRATGRTIAIAVEPTRDRDDRAGAVALRPDRPERQSSAGPLGTMPVVVLSIESVAGAPAADAEVPIVFPGYVLPDDSLEEPAHEGS